MRIRLLLVLSLGAGCGFKAVSEHPTLTCGTGTVERDGVCVGLATDGGPRLTCGSGTTEKNGACVSMGFECGPGTHVEGLFCVASVATPCGVGTHELMGKCVPDVTCGAGTKSVGGMCVPSSGLSCGMGTQEVNGACVSAVSCGAGTTLMGSQCTASISAWYDVRLATNQVPGDGFTRIQVLGLGRNADGTPKLDAVVFTISRASAGTLNPTAATLAPLGANVMLTPCATPSATCLGPATINLALASNPSVVVASADFEIVAPPGVGSPANCLPYPKAMFFDGMGYIFTGTMLVTQGTFTNFNSQAMPKVISIHVDPSATSQGAWWDLDFAAPSALTLGEQVYNGASRYPFQPPTMPGLDVGGDGRGCNQSLGRFEIQKLTMTGTTLTELVATFEQFCENQPTNVIRGCVRYTP